MKKQNISRRIAENYSILAEQLHKNRRTTPTGKENIYGRKGEQHKSGRIRDQHNSIQSGEQLKQNGRTLPTEWRNNSSKIGEPLQQNMRTTGRIR